MAEILIKTVNAVDPDPDKDRIGCYKIGMPVVVMSDGHRWGTKERPPLFYLIKVPGIDVEKVQKFIAPQVLDLGGGETQLYRRRVWQIRVADLPQTARDKLLASGGLVIAAGTYTGPYDYTWAQVKDYFRNLETGLDGADLD